MATLTPSKIPTGMCYAGWHEGTRAKDFRGNSVQVCMLCRSCPCECHVKITKMYELAEEPRPELGLENPEYVRPQRTWYMPRPGIDYATESSSSLVEPVHIEDGEDATPAIPATRARSFTPTPTGIMAPGQLENYVLEVVTEWIIYHEELCTPRFVSEEIARVQHIDPPSVGAIGAVFDRWIKYGYAEVSRKPVQFLKLTDEGERLGLDAIKAQHKRRNK